MAGPLVSVIIPNHGHNDVVGEAVESVHDTDVETEAIVVDNTGASVDGARAVRTDPQPPGHNRNAGLRVARGDYVQFLDADDRLVSLQPRVERLENGDASVAVGAEVRVNGGHRETVAHGDPGDRPAVAYLRESWAPAIGCMLVDRSVFARHRFWERLERAQDFHLWVRVFWECRVTTDQEPAFEYHEPESGRSGWHPWGRWRAQRVACVDCWRRYPELRAACRDRYLAAWRAMVPW